MDPEIIQNYYQMSITEDNRFFPGDLVAVGDVHGQIDLLWKLVKLLKDTGVSLLFLGDLIDRAKKPEDDVAVLNVIKNLREEPGLYGFTSVEALRGNHEEMFLRAVEGFGLTSYSDWACNGGSYQMFEEMSQHAGWLDSLPLYKLIDKTLYVHAGVRPWVNLKQQTKNDLIWIREPFHQATDLHVRGVKRVVHGHTPNFCGFPVVRDNRICIDTGAYWSGKLTGYNHRSGELFQVGG
jgi:serine/threonine protein phosphatase 1